MTMSGSLLERSIWQGRRVLLTGHTGFKGAWMTLLLERLGAQVCGVALEPNTSPNLFGLLRTEALHSSHFCDVRDVEPLRRVVRAFQPEIVIHMAAQALVRESYANPLSTIETNVLGTANLLEALREVEGLRAILVVTSDKVYENREARIDFTEDAVLGGHDPYAASKAAAEILVAAYRRSFFAHSGVALISARAGNVIGGGDWATDRLIPDLWNAYERHQPVLIRNPAAVRPWQHVLDPLYGYLLYLQHAMLHPESLPPALNFGPAREPARTVTEVAEAFAAALDVEPESLWTLSVQSSDLHEARFLSINSQLALATLGWRTAVHVDDAIRLTCDWYSAFRDGQNMQAFSERQIEAYDERVRLSYRRGVAES